MEFSRRQFFLLSGFGIFFTGCNGKSDKETSETKAVTNADPCSDFSDVSETELKKRQQLGYVKQSPSTESYCSNCQLWLPPKESKDCGNCQIFKGPVLAQGYCTYWAPQMS
ncbi:high-potential iron-sulfur protein [Dyadobacter subterraneus]|uniref:High-potential iron-sulfur protein n=1 Tax=Dyadobacter subterraneus TaxID=2773304 RepID=A0ABR9W7Q5_9BACT|nr:high-potential iron-sulfur protein [Dyadobacter subterraneus]MBE9461501.1 high-potential iron-sulfur protein [Dyadobacter subterraneus]